nr:GUN4 domain-containing protein [Cylindrospermopsis raciborskii]
MGLPCPYFFTPLFSQIIATSHLQPPCHPVRSEPQKKEPIKAEKSVESEVIPSRYTKLETLLKSQDFREADIETARVMLAVANKYRRI